MAIARVAGTEAELRVDTGDSTVDFTINVGAAQAGRVLVFGISRYLETSLTPTVRLAPAGANLPATIIVGTNEENYTTLTLGIVAIPDTMAGNQVLRSVYGYHYRTRLMPMVLTGANAVPFLMQAAVDPDYTYPQQPQIVANNVPAGSMIFAFANSFDTSGFGSFAAPLTTITTPVFDTYDWYWRGIGADVAAGNYIIRDGDPRGNLIMIGAFVLTASSGGTVTPAKNRVKVWTGSAWKECKLKRWNGTAWVEHKPKIYTSSATWLT